MKRRLVSFSLALLMLFSAGSLVACTDEGGDTTTPAVTTVNTPDTTVPEDTTAALAIPDEDMDEYEYMIYEAYLDGFFASGDFCFTEGSGTVLDEAKYKRNSLVEEKFNIVLSAEIVKATSTTGSTEGYSKFMQAKNAGDPSYDVCVLPAYDQTKLAQNGALYDLNSLPYLETESPYWDQNAVADLTIKDTLFFLTGDFSGDAFSAAVVIAFNKEIAKEKGINDLYTLASEGKWTFEKFKEYARLVSEDLNGDDKFTNMDLYGALCWDDAIYAVVHAAGEKCAYLDENDELVLGLGTEAVYTVFSEFVTFSKEDCFLRYQVKFSENGTATNNSSSTYGREMFSNNQGLFYIATLAAISGAFRDMEVDYGILPMFKANDSMDRYYASIAPYSARFLGVPLFVNDAEVTGKVLETIGYYSTSTVVPAYYDKTLNGTVVRDEESTPMIDLIRASRTYDLGYFYQPGNINKELIYQFRAANADWVSVYKNKERSANLYIKNINKALTEQAESWASEK